MLSPLRTLVERFAAAVARHQLRAGRDNANVEIVLAGVARAPELRGLYEPLAFIEFVRGCIEPRRCRVQVVKHEQDAERDACSRRFATLMEVLRNGPPPVPFPVARDLAATADRYLGHREPLESGRWSSDVGLHFKRSSSLGRKGRLLTNVVRFMRPSRALELGTAYGLSGLFILSALEANGGGHLTTIEGFEPQYSLARDLLTRRFPAMVSCHKGEISRCLPELRDTLKQVELVFHDAGHTREDYLRDFSLFEPTLAPGAVVLLDDIRWENPRVTKGPARTYEGWMALVQHPRVRQAVEIDGAVGALLLA